MEFSLKEDLEAKYKEVQQQPEESNNFIFKVEGSYLTYEFKCDCFTHDNFNDFHIFQSTWTLKIAELYPYKDPKFKEVYQEIIPKGLGEILVITGADCRMYVLRTVIHCLKEQYIEMIGELIDLHRKVHEEAKAKMDQFHRI